MYRVTERGTFDMIYGDRLAALFTEQTGLDTAVVSGSGAEE